MLFMGIDQSYTSCGVLVIDELQQIKSINVISSSKDVDFFERAYIISQEINKIITEFNPDYINLEGLAFGGIGNATRQLSGLQYTIVLNIRKQLNKDCSLIPPTTLKKFATGKGSSKKDALYDALPEDVKELLKDKKINKNKGRGDVVDAYWLARCALDNFNQIKTN